MKTLLSGIFVISSFFMSGQTAKNFIDQNYIEVLGKAEMKIAPDEIYLEIVIDENDLKNKQSLQEMENMMISTLEKIGIDISKDLAVKDMASNFKNLWLSNAKIIKSREYEVLVHDANTAGEIIYGFDSLGISEILIDRVDHSQIEEYRNEVKVRAIKAAKSKAQNLAKAIDQEIGKALFIQEVNANTYNNVQRLSNVEFSAYDMRYAKQGVKSINIEFEKITLEYSISARFALE